MLERLRTVWLQRMAPLGRLSHAAARLFPEERCLVGAMRNRLRGKHGFPPSFIRHFDRARMLATCLGLVFATLAASPALAGPAGTVITNQASVAYENAAGVLRSVDSNAVEVITTVIRTPATIAFTRVLGAGSGDYRETVGPASCLQNGSLQPLANPTLSGGITIDPTQNQAVSNADSYNLGEPLFIRLADADQNLDTAIIDHALVTVMHAASGDNETVQLSETGINSGIFSGYLPSSRATNTSGDCVLQGGADSEVTVTYADVADSSDRAQSQALLDPMAIVFESHSGSPISGATIALVDAVTGAPAIVYGNDGIATFPSSLISGQPVSDSAGNMYSFSNGQYRFPVVVPGDYRLQVTPPADYSAPSTLSISALQSLPNAPFQLDAGSFGSPFTVTAVSSMQADIPVDPLATVLFMQKTTRTNSAAPGDFVAYELTVQNSSTTATANNVTVVDALPRGLRFVSGSVTRAGIAIADPEIDSLSGALKFAVGPLAIGEKASIRYVTEVTAGASGKQLSNSAIAYAAAGLVSNEAVSHVALTEDLFRNSSTLLGRVVESSCAASIIDEEKGVANVRVYLEDGRYAVSDEGGRFHFEGLPPGGHVAQLDTDTVPDYFDVALCDEAPRFAGNGTSQFLDLQRGGLHEANFYLRRKAAPEGSVDLELENLAADSSEEVAYRLKLNGVGNVAVSKLSVLVLLPEGITFAEGSLRQDGQSVVDPRLVGQSLMLELPDRENNWQSEIEFNGQIAADVNGELITKAVVRFDSPIAKGQRTPTAETTMLRESALRENAGYVLNLKFDILSAELSAADRAELDILIDSWQGVDNIQIATVGHSDSTRISPRSRKLFANNYELSEARARAAANYIAQALAVSAQNIQAEGRGPNEPVADNATAAGREKNRRVEMILSGERPARQSFLKMTKVSSGALTVDTRGKVPGYADRDMPHLDGVESENNFGMPASQVEPAIASLQAGVEMLLPAADFQPAIPSTKISIKHGANQRVLLYLNNEVVNPANFDGVSYNENKTLAVSRWTGVDLGDGPNLIRAEIADTNGTIVQFIERPLHYAGSPVRAELIEELSSLVADGKTRPILAIRLLDKYGKPTRHGAVGTFGVNQPYRSVWDVENERKNKLVEIGSREATYKVGPDGIALIELQPTTQSGEVALQLNFNNNRQQEIRTWLSPAARDWILVGFAEGTLGYNTLSQNQVAADAAGLEQGLFEDGRLAFFAKGQVKGEYLLTVAYDSARQGNPGRDSFNTMVDPNQYYTLYADNSEQRIEAASQRNLYLKIERRQFVALFGDFDTGLSVTSLARYERRFNGVKSDYHGKQAGYSVFAANTDQSFIRDEIRGDGTSGLYYVSRAPLIGNSETVRIEVRDRFDTALVLSTRTLSRFLDYNLDVMSGSMFFKEPVQSRDQDFNPVYIVVEYESRSTADKNLVAGGRAHLKTADGRAEVGATYIDDGQTGAEANLAGVDLRYQVNAETLIKAEYANSDRVVAGLNESGAAQSIVLERRGEHLDLNAYARRVDDGFGMGQQSRAEQGISKFGVDARATISDKLKVNGELSLQKNLATDAKRSLGSVEAQYEMQDLITSAEVTHAADTFSDGEQRNSDVLTLGVHRSMFDNEMKLRAEATTVLNGEAASADYGSGYVLGSEYKLFSGVDLFGEYEKRSGADLDATMTRVGVHATPWERSQINSSFTNQATEFGPRAFANLGLVQGFKLNEHWALDFGIDQTKTVRRPELREFDIEREFSAGSRQEDFIAGYAGMLFQEELWSANSRVEFRSSDAEKRKTLLSGWYREPKLGHGLSAGLTMFQSERSDATESVSANLKLGWAYRVSGSRWSFLDRMDLVYDKKILLESRDKSWRYINNFNANRRFNAGSELSLQYAFKYVRSSLDGRGYSSYTDLIGVDYRRSFKGKFEAGAHSSIYTSYRSHVRDYGLGFDVGYNVKDNMWLSVGYNVTGFQDDDFSAARYTAQGPYVQFSIKADHNFLKNIAGQISR